MQLTPFHRVLRYAPRLMSALAGGTLREQVEDYIQYLLRVIEDRTGDKSHYFNLSHSPSIGVAQRPKGLEIHIGSLYPNGPSNYADQYNAAVRNSAMHNHPFEYAACLTVLDLAERVHMADSTIRKTDRQNKERVTTLFNARIDRLRALQGIANIAWHHDNDILFQAQGLILGAKTELDDYARHLDTLAETSPQHVEADRNRPWCWPLTTFCDRKVWVHQGDPAAATMPKGMDITPGDWFLTPEQLRAVVSPITEEDMTCRKECE